MKAGAAWCCSEAPQRKRRAGGAREAGRRARLLVVVLRLLVCRRDLRGQGSRNSFYAALRCWGLRQGD